jgi:hypothetical protein
LSPVWPIERRLVHLPKSKLKAARASVPRFCRNVPTPTKTVTPIENRSPDKLNLFGVEVKAAHVSSTEAALVAGNRTRHCDGEGGQELGFGPMLDFSVAQALTDPANRRSSIPACEVDTTHSPKPYRDRID